MSNLQYQTNLIIKIYHDSETDTLCLLKAKEGGSVYIAFVNLSDNSTVLLTLDNFYIKPDRYYYNPAAQPIFELLDDGTGNKVQIIVSLHAFEVCFKSERILLEVSFIDFPFVEEYPADKEGDFYLLFGLDGRLVTQQKINKKNNWSEGEENNVIRFFEPGNLAYLSASNDYEGKFERWNTLTGEYAEIELMRNKAFFDKASPYEYVDDYYINREKNLLALLFAGPTAGEDGIKVFETEAFDKFRLIFSFIDSGKNGGLHLVSISPQGDKLALLAYTGWNEDSIPNIDILIFNLDNNTAPENKFKTKINYRDTLIRNIVHYSADVLCIVATAEIFLYHLTTGAEIARLKRDDQSPYFVSDEKIFYLAGNRLVAYAFDEAGNNNDPAEEKTEDTSHGDENRLKEEGDHNSEPEDGPEWKAGIHRSNNGFVAIIILILALIFALLRAIY